MRLYESMFILKDGLSDDDRNSIIEKIRKIISDNNGEIISLQEWGKRKLAYEIKRELTGDYYLLRYNSPTDIIKEIDRVLKLEENVLRYFVTRIKKKDLEEELSDKEERVEESNKEV